MSDEEKPPDFSPVETCTLRGQVAVIMCWWIDGLGESENAFDELEQMCEAIELIPDLLTGNTEDFGSGTWWMFLDALGSYPERNAKLEELYQICVQGDAGELPPGKKTKAFCNALGDEIGDPSGNGAGQP